MDNNEILARWQGWKNDNVNLLKHWMSWIKPDGITRHNIYPNYLNDAAACDSLLDTLVEKGYIWSLYGKQVGCLCKVYKMPDVEAVAIQEGTTRREAIIAACLEVARKEMEG